MKQSIRILITDSDFLVCCGLSYLLGAEPDMEVIAEAYNCSEMLHKFTSLKPDVTVLGMDSVDSTGITALSALRTISSAAPIVVYTACSDMDQVTEAASLNVNGYLLKDSPMPQLARAIRSVAEGKIFLGADIAAKLFEHMRSGPNAIPSQKETLSRREHQVLLLMAEGKRNRYIAEQLFICERTVKFHVSAILSKLQVQNRTEAVSTALKLELID